MVLIWVLHWVETMMVDQVLHQTPTQTQLTLISQSGIVSKNLVYYLVIGAFIDEISDSNH